MVSAAIEEWVWRSHAVVAAALAPDGTIRRPNPALSGSPRVSWPACRWRR